MAKFICRESEGMFDEAIVNAFDAEAAASKYIETKDRASAERPTKECFVIVRREGDPEASARVFAVGSELIVSYSAAEAHRSTCGDCSQSYLCTCLKSEKEHCCERCVSRRNFEKNRKWIDLVVKGQGVARG